MGCDMKYSKIEVKLDIISDSEKQIEDFEELAYLRIPIDMIVRSCRIEEKEDKVMKRFKGTSITYRSFNLTFVRIFGFPQIYSPTPNTFISKKMYKYFKTLRYLRNKDSLSLMDICYVLNVSFNLVIRYSCVDQGICYSYYIGYDRSERILRHYQIPTDEFNKF